MPGREYEDLNEQAAAEDEYDQNALIAVDKFCAVVGLMGNETISDVSDKLQRTVHRLERVQRYTSVLLGFVDPELDDMFTQLIRRIKQYDDGLQHDVLAPAMQDMFAQAREHGAAEKAAPTHPFTALVDAALAHARQFREQERRQKAADRAETESLRKSNGNGHHSDDPAF